MGLGAGSGFITTGSGSGSIFGSGTGGASIGDGPDLYSNFISGLGLGSGLSYLPL